MRGFVVFKISTAPMAIFTFTIALFFLDIERQDRYAVLAAVAGVLVTLLQRAPEET